MTEKLNLPKGWQLVPVEPTRAMLDVAGAYALNVSLCGDYNWSQYMRDVWQRMLAAAPKPEAADHSEDALKMVSDWIECSERPPDDKQIVQVSGFNFQNKELGRWVQPAIYYAGDFHPVVYNEYGEAYGDIDTDLGPTHWAALLPAPKEQSDE